MAKATYSSRAGGFQFQETTTGYKVFQGGKLLGELLSAKEPNGIRHCFYLGDDAGKPPRAYRGMVMAAKALAMAEKLRIAAQKGRWSPRTLIMAAWSKRPKTAEVR